MEDLSEKVRSLPPTIWMGNEKHFVHYPIRKNNLLNFIGTVRKDAWLDQSWHQFGNKEDLKKDFGNVNSTVEEIIENIDKPALSESTVISAGNSEYNKTKNRYFFFH